MGSFVKPLFDLSIKFIINVHLLLIIVFTIFYFVPGAYFDDEHFVETAVSAPAAPKNFFLSIKKSVGEFYALDFGVTYHNRNSKVTDIIWQKAKFSLPYLGITALVLLIAPVFAAFLIVRIRKADKFHAVFRWINRVPQLVMIPLIIYFFSYVTSLVPLKFDIHEVKCLVFVVFALSLKPISQLIDLTVEKWQKEKTEMYVQFARAKGLSKSRVLIVHMFKNFANSYLGYFLTILLQILTGNFILESLYSIPGFGLGFMDSVTQRDLPLVVGYIFLFSSLFLTLHFLIQLVFLYLNPRLREAT